MSNFDLKLLCTLLLLMHWNWFLRYDIVFWYTIILWYHWIDEMLIWLIICQIDIWHDLHHNMCGGSWSISVFNFCILCFEIILVWAFMSFVNFLSWIHYDFVWMVHEIFHAIFESKERRLFWCIRVSNEAHWEILKIIESLDSDVHESTNLVID